MSKDYKKLPNSVGIYKHKKNGRYRARKKVNGEDFEEVFDTLREARQWRHRFDGTKAPVKLKTSSLKTVWETMQEIHFPTLATSTQAIWRRRYEPWKSIEHLPMEKITPSKVTSWVIELVEFFKSDYYQSSGRGKAGRCNLNNELSLFVTIFRWYKESEEFESEANSLTCPIKRKHRALGFIKPVPDKKKQISLEDALTFFQHLKPTYRNLAMMQFYTAGRVGEVAGIQWKNVDLENRRLLIKESIVWDPRNKTFLELKPFPKNKETRVCYINDEILEVLKEQIALKKDGCEYVFHIEGKALNYSSIQQHYRDAQRKAKIPYTGTHILRHGMAKLARQVGGLDAVMAMTGHKDLKLADHYSKCTEDDQKGYSELIFKKIREEKSKVESLDNEVVGHNVLKFSDYAKKA